MGNGKIKMANGGDGDGDLSTGKEQVLNWVIFENREPVGRAEEYRNT
jgi:hypothetical protein